MPSSRGSSQPRDQAWVSCIAGRWSTSWAMREAITEWWACAQSVERLTPRKPQKRQNCPDQRMCSNERRKTRKSHWNRLSVSTSIFVSGFYFFILPRKHLRLSIKPKEYKVKFTFKNHTEKRGHWCSLSKTGQHQQRPTVEHTGALCSISCNNLNGKRIRKRREMYICITEPLYCTLETNTMFLNNYNTKWKHFEIGIYKSFKNLCQELGAETSMNIFDYLTLS